jgi:FkbM family methyltransferase
MTTEDGVKHEFDWGISADNAWFHATVMKEIFVDDVYQKFFDVRPGDVVVDIGANAGPFTWSIVPKQPSRVICMEPHEKLVPVLTKNLSRTGLDVTVINKALGPRDGQNYIAGLYDPDKQAHSDGTDGTVLDTIKFSTLIREQNLTHIDFLKMDCEGGEYDFFNDENREWIHANVRKIAMEVHLTTPEQKQKFREFRDTYLTRFDRFEVLSIDYVNIKHSLFTDWFIEFYAAAMIYIDNRVSPDLKQKWQHYPAPTLEITTIIPEKGCVVDCVFCPQRTLEEVYKGNRILSLEDYRSMIDKVPTDVRITFAGFTEPWMNKYCTDMVLYAHDQGHPVSVFTTGVGVSIEDMERIVHIPFAGNPNGGFVLHLPDAEMLARHPITPGYLKTLEWIRNNRYSIRNFSIMSMGAELHPSIRHIFDSAPSYAMWSRAGNLFREAVAKPQLITLKDRWNAITHQGAKTCGCVEGLYHNVLLPNGDVSLCCMDYGLDHIIGNLHEQTYEDLIPEDQTCFALCNHCENATDPKEKVISFHR